VGISGSQAHVNKVRTCQTRCLKALYASSFYRNKPYVGEIAGRQKHLVQKCRISKRYITESKLYDFVIGY